MLQGKKKKKSELKTNLEKFGLKMKINFSTMGPLCLEYAKVIKNVYREMVMLLLYTLISVFSFLQDKSGHLPHAGRYVHIQERDPGAS